MKGVCWYSGGVSQSSGMRMVVVISAPLLVLVLASVGFVGVLSFGSAMRVATDLAGQVKAELMARVRDQLGSYLRASGRLAAINAVSIGADDPGPRDLAHLEARFYRQLAASPDVTFVGFGNTQHENTGCERGSDGKVAVRASDAANGFRLTSYAAGPDGQRGAVVAPGNPYEPSERPWWKAAVAADGPAWSPVYPNVTDFSTLYVGAAQPVKDAAGRLLGVAICTLSLSHVSEFLRTQAAESGALLFVEEADGLLIATSYDEKPFRPRAAGVDRLAATASADSLTRDAAAALKIHGQQSTAGAELELTHAGERWYLHAEPFRDGRGLEWRLVMVLPRRQVMGRIDSAMQTAEVLFVAFVAFAVLFGVVSARRLAEPVGDLARASAAMAAGDLEARVPVPGVRELAALADAFNEMASRLRKSFRVLEDTNRAIERFVPYTFLKMLGKHSVIEVERGNHSSLEIAVMFGDIRSFTPLAERLGPEGTFSLINRYLERIEPVIHRHAGIINEYQGDGVMALFPGGPAAAVDAAIGMAHAVDAFNAQIVAEGLPALVTGTGINAGPLMLGTIGGGEQLKNGVVGDAVNLASRVEGMTKMYGARVLVTARGLDLANAALREKLRELDTVVAKGKTEPITLFEVIEADAPALRDAKRATRALFAAALAAYRAGRWQDAARDFAACVERCPDDRPAAEMAARCRAHAESGGPAGWDGVTHLTSK